MKPSRKVDRVSISFDQHPSLTKQAFAEECDINNIVQKNLDKGINPFQDPRQMPYADVSNTLSFHEAQNFVFAVEDQFLSLPAELRDRFNNDPKIFMDYFEDPKNQTELQNLGLTQREPNATPDPQKPQKNAEPLNTPASPNPSN